MEEKIYVTGHKNPDTDSICAAIVYVEYLKSLGKNVIASRAGELNPETEFVLERFGFKTPELLEDAGSKTLILVDHNEAPQSPDGIDKAEIIEIIDHHKINFNYPKPIDCLTKPYGATSTLLVEIFEREGFEIDEKLAGLLLSAILSDTICFKSSTTTEKDKKYAEKLKSKAGIDDLMDYTIQMKKQKATLAGKSEEELINLDFKELKFGGKKLGIGQVEIVENDEFNQRKAALLEKMREMKEAKGYELIALMGTNIIDEATDLLFVGDKEIIQKAFEKDSGENEIFLEGVMSRKKQVVPNLEKAFS